MADGRMRGMDRGGAFRMIILALLTLDGVLVALLGTFYLPEFYGQIPVPISAVGAGLMNLGLVWAASHWATGRFDERGTSEEEAGRSSSARTAALPMFSFLATVFLLMVFGPGGDTVYGGPGIYELGPLVLILLGCAPSVWFVLRRQADAKPPF